MFYQSILADYDLTVTRNYSQYGLHKMQFLYIFLKFNNNLYIIISLYNNNLYFLSK